MAKQEHGIAWDESYKLGDEKIDQQHQELFKLLSALIEACEQGIETEKVQEAIDFLVNYTVNHFNDEEALQIKCNYPDYERHKQLHENFKVTVVNLVEKFAKSGSTAELSKDIQRIVVIWLLGHIQGEDKKIGEHIGNI